MPDFSSELNRAVRRSLAMAQARKHQHVGTEHLLLALTDEGTACEVLAACSCDIDALRSALEHHLAGEFETLRRNVEPQPTAGFQRTMQRALIVAQSAGHNLVTSGGVLVAIMAERASHAARILQEQGITRQDATNFLAHGIRKRSYG